MTDERFAEIKAEADRVGERDGKGAAGWYTQDAFGGRVTRGADESAARILKGIEDGDPEILDTIPTLDLSGQWADGATTASVLADACGTFTTEEEDAELSDDPEAADEIVEAYREGYDRGILDEIEREARETVNAA